MSALEGKVAIVTGAGRGVGKGIALAFAKAGADVAVVEVDPSSAQSTADAIREVGRKAVAVVCNVRTRGACEAAVADVVREFGAIDILVNNAIEGRPGISFLDHTDADWAMNWESGVLASFWFMQACQPHLVSRGGGSIINLGSGAGTEGQEGFAAYAAAKEAIRALSKVAALEWGPVGIRVNTICPFANSPGLQMWAANDPATYDAALSRVPLRRIGDCEQDIGAAALFLASDAASYVTAQTLMLDGGSGTFR